MEKHAKHAKPREDGGAREPSSRMSRGKKIIMGVLAIILALLLGCGIGLAAVVGSLDSSMSELDNSEEKDALLDALAPTEVEKAQAEYVAVLGSDANSEGDGHQRTDVMMLARVDTATGTVTLVSIPRDTMVVLEGHGTQKINAAYAFGGAAGAVECLSEFTGVPINHYVEVDFDSFKEVIDSLGGVRIISPITFTAYDGTSYAAGEVTLLSGEQALALVRDRHANPEGDFGRAEMQRLVLSAIADTVLSLSAAQLPDAIGRLVLCVTTDYTVPEIASLALELKDAGITLYSAVCPSYTYNVSGISYVGTRYNEWQDTMRRVDAGMDPSNKESPIPEPQASDKALGAAVNGASPHDYEDLAANAWLATE